MTREAWGTDFEIKVDGGVPHAPRRTRECHRGGAIPPATLARLHIVVTDLFFHHVQNAPRERVHAGDSLGHFIGQIADTTRAQLISDLQISGYNSCRLLAAGA